MREQVQESLTDIIAYYIRDPLTTLLLGLGITLSWSAFIGGLVLAMAGTALAFRRMKESERIRTGTSFWSAMGGGLLVSLGISIAWPHLPEFISAFPPQFGMLLGGYMSGQILTGVKRRAEKEIKRLSEGEE